MLQPQGCHHHHHKHLHHHHNCYHLSRLCHLAKYCNDKVINIAIIVIIFVTLREPVKNVLADFAR